MPAKPSRASRKLRKLFPTIVQEKGLAAQLKMSYHTIKKYKNGTRRPTRDPAVIRQIEKVTGGAVSRLDWFD